MTILQEHVESYLRSLRPQRSAVMREQEELAGREDIPIVHWETGRLLATLVAALGTRRVLEVGTAIGYSTLHMAEALPPGGRIVTLERDPQRIAQAAGFLDRAGVAGRVEIVAGDARETIPDLAGSLPGDTSPDFDLVFLDATKGEYLAYLDLALPLMTASCLLVVDNCLFGGDVALPPGTPGSRPAEATEALRRFNPEFLARPDFLGSVLPVGDGVGLAVRVG